MVAYRMMDGATVANSELMIFASDGGESEDGQYVDYVADGMPSKVPESIRYGVFIGTKYKHTTCTNNFYIQPQIVINIPEGIDTRIIESVAIYSTRIIPVYDFEQTWNGKWSLSDRGSGDDNSYMWAADFRKLFTKDVDLLQEPLYRIKEIEVRDFVKNSHKEALTYTLLKMRRASRFSSLRNRSTRRLQGVTTNITGGCTREISVPAFLPVIPAFVWVRRKRG